MKAKMKSAMINTPVRQSLIDGISYDVPRGIARNNVKKTWQLKLIRDSIVVLKGTFADAIYGGTKESLEAAAQALVDNNSKALKANQKPNSDGYNIEYAPSGKTSIRLRENLTLSWRTVRTTPFLCARVYSPALKASKLVSIGSDKTVRRDEELFTSRMSDALVFNSRVESGVVDAFEVEPGIESEAFIEAAKEIWSNETVQSYISLGAQIRKDAEGIIGRD